MKFSRLATTSLAASLLFLGVASQQAAAQAKQLTIAGIVFQEDQFMKSVLLGMKSVADKNNVELLTANTANQISKELEVVNTYEGTHDVHALIMGRAITGIPAFAGIDNSPFAIVIARTTVTTIFFIFIYFSLEFNNQMLDTAWKTSCTL